MHLYLKAATIVRRDHNQERIMWLTLLTSFESQKLRLFGLGIYKKLSIIKNNNNPIYFIFQFTHSDTSSGQIFINIYYVYIYIYIYFFFYILL